MPKSREFNHDRPLLNTSTCEHGNKLGITGVYEGDYFADPACRDAKGKPRNHLATRQKYEVDSAWQKDYTQYQQQLEKMRVARQAKKGQ